MLTTHLPQANVAAADAQIQDTTSLQTTVERHLRMAEIALLAADTAAKVAEETHKAEEDCHLEASRLEAARLDEEKRKAKEELRLEASHLGAARLDEERRKAEEASS